MKNRQIFIDHSPHRTIDLKQSRIKGYIFAFDGQQLDTSKTI